MALIPYQPHALGITCTSGVDGCQRAGLDTLAGQIVHEVADPRAGMAWLDYVSAGKELGL